MGGFISIGIVSQRDKQVFLFQCESVLCTLENFKVISGQYPTDKEYTSWNTYSGADVSWLEALEHCYQDDMAEILCSFTIAQYTFQNVLIRINHLHNLHCILFEIPDSNLLFQDLEKAESIIVAMLKGDAYKTFLYAFCDSDADFYLIEERDLDSAYSIYVKYEPFAQVFYNRWMIDGLTDHFLDE